MKGFGKSDDGAGARPYLKFAAAAEAEAPPSSTVGTLLCATRMRTGKDLQRVAEVLHIRYTHLVAIEDGRYEDLPGQAYAIGFVRAYADHLGLDGDEVVRRYKEESAGVARKALFDFPLPTPDSGVPSGALILTAVVAGMVIYGVWYGLAGSDRSAIQVIQAVPERLVTLVAPDKAAPDAAKSEENPADQADHAVSTNGPAPADGDAETVASATDVIPAKPDTVVEDSDVVELKAKADIWITLRDAQKTDHTQLLHKGEVFQVPDARGTTLVTGKASDLEVLVNGKVAPLSDDGVFARGLSLDPDRLKSPAPTR